MKRQLELENRKYTDKFELYYENDDTKRQQNEEKPIRAWRNRHFLAAIYIENNTNVRLTVNRTAVDNDGMWIGNITWDELMAVKRGIGMDGVWAVEVYPPSEEVVNLANTRHLWITDEPPFAWTRAKKEAKRQPKPSGLIPRALAWFKRKKP